MLLLSYAEGRTIYTSRPFGDTTSILGGAASALRQYIEGLLPTGYYRDFWINTEIPFYPGLSAAQRRRRGRGAVLSNVERRSFPLLSINIEPRADSSEFSTKSGFWRSTSFTHRPQTIKRFLYDDENHIYGGVETDRISTAFRVATVVETDLQAYNLQMLYKKILPNEIWMFLNDVDISVDIPGDILLVVWRALRLGNDFKSGSGSDMEKFQRYISSSTHGRVHKVLNPRTGNSSFSWTYRTNIAFRIDSRPSVSIDRTGNVVRRAMVDFEIVFDYYTPLAFSLETKGDDRALLPGGNNMQSVSDITVGEGEDRKDLGKIGGISALGGAGVRWTTPSRYLPKWRYGGDHHLSLLYVCTFITGNEETDVTDLSGEVPRDVIEYLAHMRYNHTYRRETGYYRNRIKIVVWEGYELEMREHDEDDGEDPLDRFIDTQIIKINNTKKDHEHHVAVFADLSDVASFEDKTRREVNLKAIDWL